GRSPIERCDSFLALARSKLPGGRCGRQCPSCLWRGIEALREGRQWPESCWIMRDPMSTPASKRSNGIRALLRLLQKEGQLAAEHADRIEHDADDKGVAVAELLEREGIITEKDLAVLLATTLRLRIIDLTSYPFDPGLARELKEVIATRYSVVPIR